MPITYEIDRDRGIVYHVFTGQVGLDELERYWRTFLAEPDLPQPLALYADLRRGSLKVNGEDVQRIVQMVIEPLLRGRRWISAAVIGSPTDYGVTKQFMVYSDQFGVTQVFYEPDEALAWIDQTVREWTKSAASD